jgi:Domain of unknown function (DUF4265)
MAMTGQPDLRRMAFDLEVVDDWPPVSVETLWVEYVQNGRYRVDSIPFLVRGIAVDDIVEGRTESPGEPDSLLHFTRKVEAGGHSTIQVIVIADEVTSAVKNDVARVGCRTEGSPWPSLFSIDIPNSELIDAVHGVLRVRATLGQLEYEDACLPTAGADGSAT